MELERRHYVHSMGNQILNKNELEHAALARQKLALRGQFLANLAKIANVLSFLGHGVGLKIKF